MSESHNIEETPIEDRIYKIATDKNEILWKSFLQELIQKEGLDPWNIDLGILTKKYLEVLKEIKKVDFNISGKFLTIAVFLLKLKTEKLVEKDLRGIEEKIQSVQEIEYEPYSLENLELLDSFDQEIEDMSEKKNNGEYSLKLRNPLARKRKVNIFDLIKSLEKTFEQSNKRRLNFFIRNQDVKYKGPIYEKKNKNIKVIIDDLLSLIRNEFSDKKGHVLFSHLVKDINHKEGVLDKFIPLLHLHNQNKVKVSQDKHLGEIKIHNISK